MMRNVGMISFFLLSSIAARCQGVQEWLSQKSTQTKYLVQQVAALQIYISYLKKGYDVANKGLSTIKNIKSRHLGLDTSYFNSLKTINPQVKNYIKVAGVLSYHMQILQECKATRAFVKEQETFSFEEVNYVADVLSRLTDASLVLAENLAIIVTRGKLELSDNARIQRIDKLYEEIQGLYQLNKEFSQDIKVLSLQRNSDIQDAKSIRRMYGK